MSSDQTAIVVVAAVIVQGGKVLIKQKTESHNPESVGKWEFPGGKVKVGESFPDALSREIKEELNLEIQVGRLLHSQINSYSDDINYLVLYYACTLFGVVEYCPGSSVTFVEPSRVSAYTKWISGALPGTLEAISHLGEATTAAETFSFVQNDAGTTTPDETLHIMTYELGRLIEHHHKAKRYGPQGYLGSAKKELAGLVSMCRMYCEQKDWGFDELVKLGEEDYLERMEDLRRHGIRELCTECGRLLPMHNPECSQCEKMY